MPREIKFRVWDKTEKRMWDGWVLDGDRDGTYRGGYFGDTDFPLSDITGEESREGWAFQNASAVELMQYTGLKDSQNREIFEGDILATSLSGDQQLIRYVVWDDPTARFGMQWPRPYDPGPRQITQEWINQTYGTTVIGNIYENPELL